MMPNNILSFTLVSLFVLSLFVPIGRAAGPATLKFQLPEFHDISVGKGRPGLTLFSPDGRYLALSAKSDDVVIYGTDTGKIISRIDGNSLRAFSFSPDSKFAVTQGSMNQAIRIYETDTGKLLREFRGLDKMAQLTKGVGGTGLTNMVRGIWPVMFLELGRVPLTSDWKSMLINRNDKEFSIYDFDSGTLKFDLAHEKYNSAWEKTKVAFAFVSLPGGYPAGFLLLGSYSSTNFSEDGKYLLIANGNKSPSLWNIEAQKLVAKFDAEENVYHGRFDRAGSMVATSDTKGITKLWSTKDGALISTIGDKKEKTIVAGWSRGDNKVFLATIKGDLRAYDTAGQMLYGFSNSRPKGILISHDYATIVTLPEKDNLILFQIWDAETGRLLATAPRAAKRKPPLSIKFSPNNRFLAVSGGGIGDRIEIWDMAGNLVQVLDNSKMPMEFSPDGNYLATGGLAPVTKTDVGYLWHIAGADSSQQENSVVAR